MLNRRDLMLCAAGAALFGRGRLSAATPASSRLQTCLFNLQDGMTPDQAAELVQALAKDVRSQGVDGFLLGRNLIEVQFATRFEWVTMLQLDGAQADRGPSGADAFALLRDRLAPYCRNRVECDLACPLPARYADAAGVGVRHTVLFDFKPDSPEAARQRNVDAIREMGKLPMVQDYRVEPSATTATDPAQMQWQVIGDFASVADYRAYSAAPVHLAIREDFTAHTARVAFIDVAL